MYHFRYISFKLFILLLVMPIELVGVALSSFGTAFQSLSHAIGEALFSHMVGLPENQDITKLVNLPPPPQRGTPQPLEDDDDE